MSSATTSTLAESQSYSRSDIPLRLLEVGFNIYPIVDDTIKAVILCANSLRKRADQESIFATPGAASVIVSHVKMKA